MLQPSGTVPLGQPKLVKKQPKSIHRTFDCNGRQFESTSGCQGHMREKREASSRGQALGDEVEVEPAAKAVSFLTMLGEVTVVGANLQVEPLCRNIQGRPGCTRSGICHFSNVSRSLVGQRTCKTAMQNHVLHVARLFVLVLVVLSHCGCHDRWVIVLTASWLRCFVACNQCLRHERGKGHPRTVPRHSSSS